jgi:hypothetical protein
MSETAGRTEYESQEPGQRERGVLSNRLSEFLDRLQEGEIPNAGSFCSFCYNPLPQRLSRCDHCGQDLQEHPPIGSVPREVVEMHRRMRKRESLIVNSFAFFGLGLGLALFLGLVAINVLYLDRALWFFVIATVIFLVGSRVLAGLLGGYVGDEIGYSYGHKKLAEDWRHHLSQRGSEVRE